MSNVEKPPSEPPSEPSSKKSIGIAHLVHSKLGRVHGAWLFGHSSDLKTQVIIPDSSLIIFEEFSHLVH
jgi:hypothetical protein